MTTQTQENLTVRGISVPRIGLGTWELTGEDAYEAVRDALEIGYRHVDTAKAYENEADVGRALADSGLDRGDYFLTTKAWYEQATADEVRQQLEGSLADLGVEHVDLLLLHWPNPEVPIAETIEGMEALREAGKLRAYGVSNFPTAELRQAIEASGGELFADQVEYHPFLGQSPVLELAREHEVMVTAYSPLAHGEVPDDDTLIEIGAEHGKNAAQVALRWLIDQPGVSALPRSSSHENRVANLEVFDFELSDEERERIEALPKDRRQIDPSFAPEWD
jgi:2,5-diketo-D-gluconate reductase B